MSPFFGNKEGTPGDIQALIDERMRAKTRVERKIAELEQELVLLDKFDMEIAQRLEAYKAAKKDTAETKAKVAGILGVIRQSNSE